MYVCIYICIYMYSVSRGYTYHHHLLIFLLYVGRSVFMSPCAFPFSTTKRMLRRMATSLTHTAHCFVLCSCVFLLCNTTGRRLTKCLLRLIAPSFTHTAHCFCLPVLSFFQHERASATADSSLSPIQRTALFCLPVISFSTRPNVCCG